MTHAKLVRIPPPSLSLSSSLSLFIQSLYLYFLLSFFGSFYLFIFRLLPFFMHSVFLSHPLSLSLYLFVFLNTPVELINNRTEYIIDSLFLNAKSLSYS